VVVLILSEWEGRPGEASEWEGRPGEVSEWEGRPGEASEWEGRPGEASLLATHGPSFSDSAPPPTARALELAMEIMLDLAQESG